MCGLVGVAGVITTKDVDVFNEMLYHDYVRGKDSTGVGAVHEMTGAIKLIKGIYDPIGLMSMTGYASTVNSVTKVLMGHNRAATRGKVMRHNAHPFATDDILMAHNGTLDYTCMSDLAKNIEGDTDSERLMATIAELDGDIPGAIARAQGAWAITVYIKADNTISLLRNDKRPLFYCYSESKKTLYWASEAGLLNWVLERHGIKRGKIYDLTPDTIKVWTIPKSNEFFNDATRIKAEGKQPTNFQRTYGGPHSRGPWENWGVDDDLPMLPRGNSAGSSGSNSGKSNSSGTTLLDDPSPADFEPWLPYGEGYSAHDDGALRTTNPYKFTTKSYSRWAEGWDDAKKYGGAIDDINKAKKEEARKPASNVVSLDDKRTKIYDTRIGPEGRRINAVQFRELTNLECSWCNDPVDFEDKGSFHKGAEGTSKYYCEGCKTQQKELNKHG